MSRLQQSTFPGFGDRRGWLTVHTLSEFVFCPRAGVIAYDNQEMDEVDVKPPRFNLDYLPDYSVALIEEALQHQMRDLWRKLFRLLATLAFTLWLYNIGWLIGLASAAGLLIVVGWQFSGRLEKVLILAARRREAMAAQAREPIQTSDQMQRVNWWELLRAGYESEVDEMVLEDDTMQVAGRPWRILKKGSLRIPVVKALTPEGREVPAPRAQHCARIAAYCRLIAKEIGVSPPFGIVIFGNTYDGWTIPNTEKLQQELNEIVELAKEHLANFDSQHSAIEPGSTAICAGCPHGEPFPVESLSAESGPIRGSTSQKDGKLYRSKCGELFGWVPPHRLAEKLRIYRRR